MINHRLSCACVNNFGFAPRCRLATEQSKRLFLMNDYKLLIFPSDVLFSDDVSPLAPSLSPAESGIFLRTRQISKHIPDEPTCLQGESASLGTRHRKPKSHIVHISPSRKDNIYSCLLHSIRSSHFCYGKKETKSRGKQHTQKQFRWKFGMHKANHLFKNLSDPREQTVSPWFRTLILYIKSNSEINSHLADTHTLGGWAQAIPFRNRPDRGEDIGINSTFCHPSIEPLL